MNTIKELKMGNESYDSQYGLNEMDLEKVQGLIPLIEGSRSKTTPEVGDIVQFTNSYGDYHAFAHIDKVCLDQLYICEKPYVPFVEVNSQTDKISATTSGGAWVFIPKNIRYVGTEKKLFKTWGHNGPCANGTVHFSAEVSVWEYTKGEHQFTTKTHDKFRVYDCEHDKDTEYNYLVSKGSTSHTAFKTKEEYERWLKTFHGVETAGFNAYNTIVWTYKQKNSSILLEDYLAIENAVIDSYLWNGKHYECKRVTEGTTVTTYMPYMSESIEVKNKENN